VHDFLCCNQGILRAVRKISDKTVAQQSSTRKVDSFCFVFVISFIFIGCMINCLFVSLANRQRSLMSEVSGEAVEFRYAIWQNVCQCHSAAYCITDIDVKFIAVLSGVVRCVFL
jgi:hypothetical protein